MNSININVSEFTKIAGGRYQKAKGKNSGETFYHEILNPKFTEAVRKETCVFLDFSKVLSFGPSFIDEAIGNLIYDFGIELVLKYLKHNIKNQLIVKLLEDDTYNEWQNRRIIDKKPKKTVMHKAWYYLDKKSNEMSIREPYKSND